MTKDISVIIPTLNEHKRLPKLLDSLIDQTEKKFEVIIVDAQSEDNTLEEVKKYQQRLPLTLLSTSVRNVGHQRNLGAGKAKTDYLMFCDADIGLDKEFLSQVLAKLNQIQVDFATTRGIPDSRRKSDVFLTYGTQAAMFIAAYVKKPFMSGENLIIKKKVFDAIGGFDEKVILADDHALVQKAAGLGYKGRVFWFPTHLFSFRRFEREGRLVVIRKYLKAFFHLLVKGPIKTQIYNYHMGGKLD